MSEKRSAKKRRCAFTLVEMMVSMAILGLIVLLLARVFSDSSTAYKKGLKQSDQNLNGRVILDYVARELRQAIVDENLQMKVQPSGVDPYDMSDLDDWVSFTAIGGKTREVELIRYYLRADDKEIGGVPVVSYELMRGLSTQESTINSAYKPGSDWYDDKGTAHEMVRNVSGFAVRLFDEDGNLLNNSPTYSTTNLPAYADLYLGLLGDSDLVEAHLTQNTDNFIHKREMIFMKRVYFRNRQGYNSSYGRKLYEESQP